MSTLTANQPLAFGPYARLDAAWKHLLETGGRNWLKVWRNGIYYVKCSNAWPKPYQAPEDERGDS